MTSEPVREFGRDGVGPRLDGAERRLAVPRGLAILLGIAAAVIILAGIRAAAWLVGPTFLALVIVIALSPVQRWLLRRGRPAWAGTVVLVIAVYALILGFVLIVVVSLARLADQLPAYASNAEILLGDLRATLAGLGIPADQARAATDSLDLAKVLDAIGSLLSGATGALASLVFLLALLLFLSLEAAGMPARLASLAADNGPVANALNDFAAGTRTYLVVTTVFGAIVAVLDTIALALLSVPLAALWGLLSFVTNYIPNIGFFLGLVPPALLALLVGGWPLLIWVVVLYIVLNFVVQSLIQPRFVGDSVGLSPTVVFVALLFWTWMIGPVGALLAIPLTLLAKAFLVDIDPRASWADAWLRYQPPPVTRRR